MWCAPRSRTAHNLAVHVDLFGIAERLPNSELQTPAGNVDRTGHVSGLELVFVAHVEQHRAVRIFDGCQIAVHVRSVDCLTNLRDILINRIGPVFRSETWLRDYECAENNDGDLKSTAHHESLRAKLFRPQ